MANFHAVYYRDADGTEPVRQFIDALEPEGRRAAIRNYIDRLNLCGDEMPHLPFPHSSQIEGELRELRPHFGRDHYRVLYRRSERLLILLHIFPKRTKQVREAEKQVARDRWDDYRKRMDADPRVPPRAAGWDAP